MRVAVADDVLGQRRRESRHTRQQGRRGHVHVDAHRVHAVLDHGIERARQPRLVHIVLVLAHADRLRIDLHQFRQWILQAARDRHRATQADVQVRQLLRGERRSGVHRGAGLGHHHLGQAQFRQALDQLRGEPVGLARGGAVADADQLHGMLAGQVCQRMQAAFEVVARRERIDRGGLRHFAGVIDDGHLHAGADARVQPHRHAGAGRRGQQQVVQIATEHADGLFLGTLAQRDEHLRLQLQRNLELPGPAHGVAQPGVGGPALVAHAVARGDADLAGMCRGRCLLRRCQLLRQFQRDTQDVLGAAAEQRQRAMRGHRSERLAVIEVVAEFRAGLFLAFGDLRHDDAVLLHVGAQLADQFGVLGELLDQDLPRTVERGLCVGHARVVAIVAAEGLADEARRFGGGVERGIGEQALGQRRKARLPCDLCACAPLGLERKIEVFESLLAVGRLDAGPQGRRELLLLLDALQHRLAAFFQRAQVLQPLVQRAQLRIVEPAGGFLAVARDERHGGAAVNQCDGGRHLCRPDRQFGCETVLDRGQHDASPMAGKKGRALCRMRAGPTRLAKPRGDRVQVFSRAPQSRLIASAASVHSTPDNR